jgi:hypothetical protein
MTAFNALTLIVTFFSFVIIYNKSVKNSVNKSDVDEAKNEMKTYVDDKNNIKDKEIRGIYHHIQNMKDDNNKDHDRIRREYSDILTGMSKQLDLIYNHLLNQKK